jgi:hypothetical protein
VVGGVVSGPVVLPLPLFASVLVILSEVEGSLTISLLLVFLLLLGDFCPPPSHR